MTQPIMHHMLLPGQKETDVHWARSEEQIQALIRHFLAGQCSSLSVMAEQNPSRQRFTSGFSARTQLAKRMQSRCTSPPESGQKERSEHPITNASVADDASASDRLLEPHKRNITHLGCTSCKVVGASNRKLQSEQVYCALVCSMAVSCTSAWTQ